MLSERAGRRRLLATVSCTHNLVTIDLMSERP
jgi:hypothetical protein